MPRGFVHYGRWLLPSGWLRTPERDRIHDDPIEASFIWCAPRTGQSSCCTLSQDFREQPLLVLEFMFIEEMKCSQGRESLLSYIVRKTKQWRGENEAIYTGNGVESLV